MKIRKKFAQKPSKGQGKYVFLTNDTLIHTIPSKNILANITVISKFDYIWYANIAKHTNEDDVFETKNNLKQLEILLGFLKPSQNTIGAIIENIITTLKSNIDALDELWVTLSYENLIIDSTTYLTLNKTQPGKQFLAPYPAEGFLNNTYYAPTDRYRANNFQGMLLQYSTLYVSTDGLNLYFTYAIPILTEIYHMIYISPLPFYSNNLRWKVDISPFGALLKNDDIYLANTFEKCEQIDSNNYKCKQFSPKLAVDKCQIALILNTLTEASCKLSQTRSVHSFSTGWKNQIKVTIQEKDIALLPSSIQGLYPIYTPIILPLSLNTIIIPEPGFQKQEVLGTNI